MSETTIEEGTIYKIYILRFLIAIYILNKRMEIVER